MDKSKIKSDLLTILAKAFNEPDDKKEILAKVNLVNELAMDSITFIAIIVEVEKHFDILISEEFLLMEKFQFFDNIVDIIEHTLHDKSTIENLNG